MGVTSNWPEQLPLWRVLGPWTLAAEIHIKQKNVAAGQHSHLLGQCLYIFVIDTPLSFYIIPRFERPYQARWFLFSKLLAQPPFHYFFRLLWLQNFKQLFLTHFCTDSLDSLSKCVLLIITEAPIPLSKYYYLDYDFSGWPSVIFIDSQFFCKISGL